MRSSILPTSLMLFLLLCFAGCGGGDSTEVADAEGGDGSTETGASEEDMGPGGMEMSGGSGSGGGMDEMSGDEGSGDNMEEMYGDEGMEEMSGEGMEEMYNDEDMSGDEGMEEMSSGNMEEMYNDEEMSGDEGMEEMSGNPEDMYGDEGMEEMSGDEGMTEGMEDMYGEESSGGGPEGMYSGGGRPGMDGGTGRPKQAAQPKTYADMATQAFGQGRDADAFQYLFAHALTADDQSAGELLGKMGWIPPLKRPGLAVRWGIGIEFNNRGYNGDQLFPIGTTQQMPTGRSPRGGGRNPTGIGQGRGIDEGGGFGGPEASGRGQPGFGGGDMGGGMQGGRGGGSNAQLDRFTGELGQKVVEGLRVRIERGDFGLVLKEAGSGAAPNQGPGMGAGGQMGQFGSGPEAYGEEESGGFDSAGPPRGMGGAGGRQAAATQVLPGVTFLDVAPGKELVKIAQENGIDALCVFSVTVSFIPRKNLVANKVEIQLYNVTNGKKEYESDELANLFVQAERAKENARGGDPVDKLLEELFQEIDDKWKLAALPSLQDPENVALFRDRWAQLQEPGENPLAALAEIRMYHTRMPEVIQASHMLAAFQGKTNDHSGSMLATGTEAERKQVIQPWLPR